MLDVNKVKGFLMARTETFRASKGDSLGAAFRYYAVLLVIWAILASIVWVSMSVWAFQDALARIANMGFSETCWRRRWPTPSGLWSASTSLRSMSSSSCAWSG